MKIKKMFVSWLRYLFHWPTGILNLEQRTKAGYAMAPDPRENYLGLKLCHHSLENDNDDIDDEK